MLIRRSPMMTDPRALRRLIQLPMSFPGFLGTVNRRTNAVQLQALHKDARADV